MRELARVCSLFVIHARPGAWIDPELLDNCLPGLRSTDPNPKAGPLLAESVPMRDAVSAFQRELILSRLELHGGSVKAVRESLGLPKVTFYRLLKKLGILVKKGGEED